MSEHATLQLAGETYEFPIVVGTEKERGIDVTNLRAQTKFITLDPGFGNTGSCESGITFVDGENGVLRYRGYPIDELAEQSRFTEAAQLLIWGELPTEVQNANFRRLLTRHELLHEDMRHHFEAFPSGAPPMAILSAMINATGCFHVEPATNEDVFEEQAAQLISQVRTIAAFAYRKAHGLPFVYPKPNHTYTGNFLHMLFSLPNEDVEVDPEVERAMDLIFLLHADHEQNCSTSTVRMVASSKANLFASTAAGVGALWGPLHGGANQAVIEMLKDIHQTGDDGSRFIERSKDKDSGARLMGFGHRVYKNYDPRAKIIKKRCDALLKSLKIDDPLLDIAQKLEEVALSDDYFVERKLYPNVDFYSGIIMRAIGIPLDMFTTIFAIGRMPGWIAHYKEVMENPRSRISRPRQVYQGPNQRHYVPMDQRD